MCSVCPCGHAYTAIHTYLYIHTCTRRANLTTFILYLFFHSFLKRHNLLCCPLSTLRVLRSCSCGYVPPRSRSESKSSFPRGPVRSKVWCHARDVHSHPRPCTWANSTGFYFECHGRDVGENTLIKHGSDWRAGLKHKKAHAGYITNYSDSENMKTKTVTLDMETK